MSTAATPTENVVRGTLLSLIVIPVGIAIFVLLGSVHITSSYVSLVVGLGAFWLYRRGAGVILTRVCVFVVLGVVIVTVLLGLYFDFAYQIAMQTAALPNVKDLGDNVWDVLGMSSFWNVFNANFGDLLNENVSTVLIALVLGALGAFFVLRRVFAATKARPVAAFAAPVAPTAPQSPVVPRDIENAATGSADEKTAPPTTAV